MVISVQTLLQSNLPPGPSGFSGYSGQGLSGFSGFSGAGGSGFSGYSGISGYSGVSGFSGYSGVGTSGFSGYSGISGYSGRSGYSGISGFSGYSGISGYSGVGTSGFSGYSGVGTSGFSGYSGAGQSGFSGYSGISGYSGVSGFSGYSGISGYSGFSGYSGRSGYSGLGTSGFSGFSGALSAWTVKTTTYTAVNGDRIVADSTAGPFTVTLPATPSAGFYVQVADGNNWAANNVTIGRNSSTIADIADDLTLDVQGAIVELVYDGSTWEPYASVGTGTASLVTVTGTQTLTNKRITPRTNDNGATTSGTITPTGDSSDQYEIVGLTGTITIAAPSGTPTAGQKLTLRIKDNGTTRTVNWTTTSGGYRVIGTTLPTATTASKNIYVGCVYNDIDIFWDVVAVATEA